MGDEFRFKSLSTFFTKKEGLHKLNDAISFVEVPL